MLIECEFTNATDYVRERVTLLTGMRLLIDHSGLLYAVSWDESKHQPTASIAKLHRAMHDSEFRIHLDREGYFITLARCLGAHWTIWFIGVDWRPRTALQSHLLCLQRAIRRRAMQRRLMGNRVFSKAVAARDVLTGRLRSNSDVVELILFHYVLWPKRTEAALHLRPLRWVKPESDGQIFA
jgi:hypothetical protein